MAVEAHHHLLHTQKLAPIHAGWEGGGGGLCCDTAPAIAMAAQASVPGRQACFYYGGGRDVVAAGRQSQMMQQQLQSSCAVGPLPAAALASVPMMMMGQACAAADASESGVTFGGAHQAQEVMASRKRKRVAEQPQVLAAGVAAHLQQQLLDVDRIVVQHTAKMSAELAEHRRRQARLLAAQVEAAAAKRLRAKDEEIARAGRLNWALEERVRNLAVEAQVWRDLAQSNEAAATALRAELQLALDAQARRGVVASANGVAAAADDAASCCCGENDVTGASEEDEVGTSSAGVRRCAACGEGRAEVLLLPCRHLCACAACGAAATACPACGCAKNGSVCVNFS